MVDLKSKPYYLDDDGVKWVEETIDAMTLDGKIGQLHEQNRILQENSKIPLLIASNAEAGGNGACTDGTYVGYPIKLGATSDPKWAYEMGRISGVESSAIGCNWAFAPVVDLLINWRNPIISNRAFGADPDLVLECGKAYLKGMQESNVACAIS